VGLKQDFSWVIVSQPRVGEFKARFYLVWSYKYKRYHKYGYLRIQVFNKIKIR